MGSPSGDGSGMLPWHGGCFLGERGAATIPITHPLHQIPPGILIPHQQLIFIHTETGIIPSGDPRMQGWSRDPQSKARGTLIPPNYDASSL